MARRKRTEPIGIDYNMTFDDGKVIEIKVCLDPTTLELLRDAPLESLPDWTLASSVNCEGCRLEGEVYCPVAASLSELVDEFGKHISYERVKLQVTTAQRTIIADTTVQAALSSLTGIYMVTVGCRYMDPLRPMVRFHLPLADLDETRYRAFSMYLLAQYMRKRRGLSTDWDFEGLEDVYAKVHRVNLAIAKAIRKGAERDANANALVRLDLFTDGVTVSIRDQLRELEHLFEVYLEDD